MGSTGLDMLGELFGVLCCSTGRRKPAPKFPSPERILEECDERESNDAGDASGSEMASSPAHIPGREVKVFAEHLTTFECLGDDAYFDHEKRRLHEG
mmetsp:Transcript_78357/g.196734  ORF Transcript_78357/g.196734 Transcript_78357/m.196734 type:complete len:97 (-) Transcript_78357:243-533(-)